MKITFTILTLLFVLFSFGQQSSTQDIIADSYKSFLSGSKEQRIHLQPDRKIYIAGDKIWFKALLVNSFTNKQDFSSNNLFADFVDNNDSVISKLVLDIKHSNTDGAFTIPDSLKTGIYWIRCYTARMLNQPELMSIQPIYILNKNMRDETSFNNKYINSITNKKDTPVIRFFPERLTGISGIISTGVISVTDKFNNPLIVTGSILNNDTIVTSFTTNKMGLSRVSFVAHPDQEYIATTENIKNKVVNHFKNTDNKKAQISATNQTQENIKVFVTLEDNLPANFETIILAMHGDSLCFASVGNGSYGINIPLNNFPGGITSLLLFNHQQQLLDERNIYISKDNYNLKVEPNKNIYTARDSVTLKIKTNDINAQQLKSFTISVQEKMLADISDSIAITGIPYTDAFQLQNWLSVNENKFSASDIDLLMVTSKTKEVYLENQNFPLYYDNNETLLNLKGKVITKKNLPAKDREITVMSKNTSGFFFDTDSTKQDGSFSIPLPQTIDSLSLSIQVRNKQAVLMQDDSVQIDNFNFPVLKTPEILKNQYKSFAYQLVKSVKTAHIDTSLTFQGKGWLKPVTVSATTKEEVNYDVSKRINSISKILTKDKFRYGGYGAVGNAILTVPGVTLSFGDISIFGAPVIDANGIQRPLILMDGVPITVSAGGSSPDGAVMQFLNSLNPADIDFIEVLRGGEAAIYGMRGANGVISVNTNHGVTYANDVHSYLKDVIPVTYHKSPRFYMPDYSTPAIKNNNLPDPRTTIYWNPNITIDEKGEALIKFYTGDVKTPYVVTLSGISSTGDIIYKRVIINN